MKISNLITLIAFTIIWSITINCFSQADNLDKEFINSDLNDTSKINKLIKLAQENNSESYIDKAYKILSGIKNDNEKIGAIAAIGNYYYSQKQYQKAIDFYELFSDVYVKLKDDIRVSDIYKNLGLLYKIIGVFDKSLIYYQKSLDIELKLDNKERIAYGYGSVGNLYKKLSNYEKALDYYQKALQLDEELGLDNGIAYTCNGLGSIMTELGKYDKAIEYYKRALDINLKIENEKGTIYSYASIGDIYMRLKDYKKAIEYNEKALHLSDDIGAKSSKAHALSNLGYIYKETHDYKRALDYFKLSLSINKEINQLKPASIIHSEIGYIYAVLGLKNEALKYVNDGLAIAQALNSYNELATAYYTLAQIYSLSGSYDKAYEYQVLYCKIKDSIYAHASAEKMAEMQTRFETERKEKENKILKQEQIIQDIKLRRQFYLSLGVSLLLILVLIFVVFLLKSNAHKRKVNNLLSKQKEEIDKQASALEKANFEISKKNAELTDSIAYAKRIQDAMMPAYDQLKKKFNDSFLIYLPKAIVSGDFIWYSFIDGKIVVATADCTGHGVPGAFMSLIGISFLNKTINEKGIIDPAEILNQLRLNIMNTLHKTGKPGESMDGMDISIVVIDKHKNKMEFASVMNPIYMIRDNTLNEYVTDKMPIGMFELLNKSYSKITIDFQENDKIYLFSDGYADQFGGKRGSKFKYNNFKKILVENCNESMDKQMEKLIQTYKKWKGNNEQVDDILILGIKL